MLPLTTYAEAAKSLRDLLCGGKAPTTVKGREAQTVKLKGSIIEIFTQVTPSEIRDRMVNGECWELVHDLVSMVFERDYLVSSRPERVVNETTDFQGILQKYNLLCRVALLGKKYL